MPKTMEVPEPAKNLTPTSTPVPTPSVTPTPKLMGTSEPTEVTKSTKSSVPTATPVPTQSFEPKCGENFILKNDKCICDEVNFVLRGGNCYHKCGAEKTSPDDLCVCPDGYEIDTYNKNCRKKCMEYAYLSDVTGECICNENFIKKDDECICDERDSDLIGGKCLLKPGEHEKRVINGDIVDYICEPGYKHDKDKFCQKVISKKRGLWGWLFAKRPEQCYNEKKDYWLNRYENGTATCRRNGQIWDCSNKSCKEINKRNKNKL